jgi:hypothetical protein
MINGSLTARKTSDDPPIYRVWFDDGTGELEVGSISKRQNHVTRIVTWHWGVDTFPLAGGNPDGDVLTFGEAQAAFREHFLRWVNELEPGMWQRNRDYKKATAARRP